MDFQFILLSIIQALTEFLPISSSGHLIIFENVFGFSAPGTVALLHLPTALVILFIYRKELLQLARTPKSWLVILVAMIPAGIIGLILGDIIDLVFYSPLIIAINQIFWGIVLVSVSTDKKVFERKETGSVESVSIRQSLIIGLAQVLALIPGTSRSGITTITGTFTGLAPRDSANFSFIVGFPLILAASLVGLYRFFTHAGLDSINLSAFGFLTGMIICFILGIFAIRLFVSSRMRTVMKFSGLYRVAIGLFMLIWLL